MEYVFIFFNKVVYVEILQDLFFSFLQEHLPTFLTFNTQDKNTFNKDHVLSWFSIISYFSFPAIKQ